ncbi:maleylpyruvate isomerase family mycothiol-dependent enzyme [Actinomadura craniellae]|uniref:Maleylpyruvate isomerase family mycothiol-dependent enzyme n=1 Tax=Actinomadura craniellae TaxID=2231787 RepID=A0A365HA45_9ACTN|nr:maleylpyruvate isomerase family mycothiol-dependent enzyme [Actinomadura craniellae]RAY15899.1 maleylpyruvate isomerase family mycothiol-dependent enzyme [Actinomadura craniellae]
MLTFDRYRTEIAAQTDALADTIAGSDLALAVPTCPRWNLDKLVRHVGGAHLWAATLVERRATEFLKPERQESPDDHPAYLRECAARLVAVLGEAGPEVPVWTWTDERSAGYWARRMTHETVVHRADACLALGRPYDLAPDLAADALTEALEMVLALRGNEEALRGSGETLRFHAPGTGEWQVRLAPAGPELAPGAAADVTASGPVTDLLLALLRRLPPDRLKVSGRDDLLDRWLANTSL